MNKQPPQVTSGIKSHLAQSFQKVRPKYLLCLLAVWLLALSMSVSGQKERPRVQLKSGKVVGVESRKAATSGKVMIVSDPPEATVLIDGRAVGKTAADGSLKKPVVLPAGKHQIEITRAEYEPWRQEMIITGGETRPVRASLKARFGWLQLNFNDAATEAQIQIDHQPIATSALIRHTDQAFRLKVAPGEHQVQVTQPGKTVFTTPVTIEVDQPTVVMVALRSEPAVLLVKSLPGARVYVNGLDIGIIPTTGMLKTTVSPDIPAQIHLEQDGYEPFQTSVTLSAGEQTSLDATLTLLPTTVEFSDSFQEGLKYWNAPKEWTADQELVRVQGENTFGTPRNKRFCDSDVVFGLRLVDGKGAAWAIRIQNETNYYLFCLNGPDGHSPNKLQTFLCRNGKLDLNDALIPAQPIIPALKVGEDYRVRIRIQGNRVQHWITSAQTGEESSIGFFEDGLNWFPCGNIGFATPNGETFLINGFTVRPIQNK
ncbi:MAG TPA: PEGA domain-containing protein [Acidobacteriota bacterium]|nr:PEGA domain-containing protein [Acidobacteriota bacterium]